jgi:hypothetical protein
MLLDPQAASLLARSRVLAEQSRALLGVSRAARASTGARSRVAPPPDELSALVAATMGAASAARAGDLPLGYETVLSGLAQALKALEAGDEWAPDLVQRWEYAVEAYAARWGLGPV